MLIVACCVVFVGGCLLFVVSFVARNASYDARCLLSVVCYALRVV